MKQRSLVVLSGVILLVGLTAVAFTEGRPDWFSLVYAVGLLVLWLVIQQVLQHRYKHGDQILFPMATLLCAIGLTILYRLKPQLFMTQIIWIALGCSIFLAVILFLSDIEIFADYKYICGLLGVFLLLSTILFGVEINGNKNWLILGPLHVQPSEFAKILIVLFLGSYLSERRELLLYVTQKFMWLEIPHIRILAPFLMIWGLTTLMFIVQKDLGSALLFFGTAITMAYIASGKFSFIAVGSTLFFAGSWLTYWLYPHVRVRVDIWLDPWSDPTGKAYQIVQSLFALGSGGLLGSGLTFGYPNLIPEVHTDFIFAAIGEELGFAGSAAVLMTYILLIYRSFRIAWLAESDFKKLVASGLAIVSALQIFLIIGGVTKFFPLTGITLPLISYGGSSAVSYFLMLGLLFSISAVNEREKREFSQ